MIINVDVNDPRPIYIQIVDEVRRAIVLGILSPDAPLPSVRQLAIDLRINPNTVSQAYRELEHQGLAYVRRGQGTFVRCDPPNGAEREALVNEVAARALLDAHRSSISVEELLAAIQRAAAVGPVSSTAVPPLSLELDARP
jgi:GntR family transcriptional regulator